MAKFGKSNHTIIPKSVGDVDFVDNQSMGGNRITNAADGTDDYDYITKQQLTGHLTTGHIGEYALDPHGDEAHYESSASTGEYSHTSHTDADHTSSGVPTNGDGTWTKNAGKVDLPSGMRIVWGQSPNFYIDTARMPNPLLSDYAGWTQVTFAYPFGTVKKVMVTAKSYSETPADVNTANYKLTTTRQSCLFNATVENITATNFVVFLCRNIAVGFYCDAGFQPTYVSTTYAPHVVTPITTDYPVRINYFAIGTTP